MDTVILPTLLGFALAQLVNLVAFVHWWYVKPRLRIQPVGDNHVLLDHEAEISSGEFCREATYGFRVQNHGRKVARGVRAFLVKIEMRDEEDETFRQVSVHTYLLPWYGPGSDKHPATLVPKASITVELGRWREDLDVVMPATGLEEYYEEGCSGADQFRFTVAVIEDGGEHASHAFTIDNPAPG
jgi:hypothetical protein